MNIDLLLAKVCSYTDEEIAEYLTKAGVLNEEGLPTDLYAELWEILSQT